MNVFYMILTQFNASMLLIYMSFLFIFKVKQHECFNSSIQLLNLFTASLLNLFTNASIQLTQFYASMLLIYMSFLFIFKVKY
jgi:hypothetical protein